MKGLRIDQQRHGYVSGHQLLATSTTLPREDQDVVDRLSDIGGQPSPGEVLPDYLTGYPLPSGQYFSFARTWYDLSAPRAGCVLTHTLLIPMAAWATARSLLALTRCHRLFERERSGKSLPQLDLPPQVREPYPFAHSNGFAELCESIFLEERQPIVWLTEPDKETTLRVVEALWPALRARFAFQTYALKPRFKAEGLFDLMVAPRSARSRFSSWDGRRVEGDAPARHQFTPLLVESIFETPFPDLDAADPLGVLARDQVGDVAKLRLSILWNSLRRRGTENLNTLLGMLDVLSAAALPPQERWKHAEPLFQRVFEVACSPEGRTANLMELALGKLEQGDGERLARSLSRSIASLTKSEPETSVRLASTSWRDSSANPILRQAVAEALTGLRRDRIWKILQDAPSELTLDLLERVPRLVIELAGSQSEEPDDWLWLASLIGMLDDRVLDETRFGILDHVMHGAQASLLGQLLADLEPSDLASAIRHLDKGGGFRNGEIVDAFAALPSHTRTEKLEALAIAKLGPAHARPAFKALLRPTVKDIDWLLDARLPQRLKVELLISLLADASQNDRRKAGSGEGDLVDKVLAVLLSADVGDEMAAKLLIEGDRLSDATFALAVAHYGAGTSPWSREVVAALIDRVTPLCNQADAARLEMLFRSPIGAEAAPLAAPSIAELLIPERARDEETTYSLALVLAARLPDRLRKKVVEQLPLVSGRLSRYRAYKLDPLAYEAWAFLVAKAIAQDPPNGLVAAESAVAYALNREFATVFPLARVGFPTAFNAALKLGRKGRRDAEQLARALARLFIRNRWDGVAFLEMALETDDYSLVLNAAADNWEGPEYLYHSMERYQAKLAVQTNLSPTRGLEWNNDTLGRKNVSKT